MKPRIQFTCEHCGASVRFAVWKGQEKPRNHCPECLWSKHVAIGDPCGGMMRGTDVGNEEVVWRCLGCGFMMRAPTDEYTFRTVTDLYSTNWVVYRDNNTPVKGDNITAARIRRS